VHVLLREMLTVLARPRPNGVEHELVAGLHMLQSSPAANLFCVSNSSCPSQLLLLTGSRSKATQALLCRIKSLAAAVVLDSASSPELGCCAS
jgi:hypothetical protein